MYSMDKTEKWFAAYTDTFRVEGRLLPMQELKLRHSRRVQQLASAIAEALEWQEENDAWLAHAVGLLHDTARFSQYRDYGTFFDALSFDHGDRGAELLEAEFDWQDTEKKVKDTVLAAVRFHNKLELPANLPLSVFRFCALIRDADKIDVFRMVQHRIDNGTVYEMLPRHEKVEGLSPALVKEIEETGRGSYRNARSLQDYRLIQLTWGLDLNFSVSAATLREENIFGRIAQDLRPWKIDALVASLLEKIDKL